MGRQASVVWPILQAFCNVLSEVQSLTYAIPREKTEPTETR